MLDVVGRHVETVAGIRLELRRVGRGRPLLLLHSEDALECEAPFLDLLTADHEVIIPSSPGFGRSERPDWVSAPDDIAYVTLEVLDRLKLGGIDVLGCSLGGWIALEMATKEPAAFSRMALVAPYGAKFVGPTERDIADIWMLPPAEVTRRKWFDPKKGERDYKAMPEDKLSIIGQQRELCRFCWEPYMHNQVQVQAGAGEGRDPVHLKRTMDRPPAYGRTFADHSRVRALRRSQRPGTIPTSSSRADSCNACALSLIDVD
jgi:pimeloyl-ACP methyl ester carboxylesterase